MAGIARPEPKLARRLLPEALLPPVHPGGGPLGHNVKQIGRHPTRKGWLRIVTNAGQWDAHPDVAFDFPRRHDGSTVDWFERGEDPYPTDLAVGDTLRPVQDPPWETGDETIAQILKTAKVSSFDQLPGYLQDSIRDRWRASAQEVTAIWAPSIDAMEWWVMCYDKVSRARRQYLCHVAVPLTFPREVKSYRRTIGKEDVELVYYGPYIYEEYGLTDEGLDGCYLFATHPYGRGRWPAALGDPLKLKVQRNEVRITRHPVGFQWERFIFVPDAYVPETEEFKGLVRTRHPKDPKTFKRR